MCYQYCLMLPAFGREYVADIVLSEIDAIARQTWMEYVIGVPCRIVARRYM